MPSAGSMTRRQLKVIPLTEQRHCQRLCREIARNSDEIRVWVAGRVRAAHSRSAPIRTGSRVRAVAKVRVDKAAAQRVLDETVTPALSAPVTIQGSDGTKAEVPVSAIAASLTFTPKDDGTLAVAIDPAALQAAEGDDLKAFGSGAKDARFSSPGKAGKA